MDGRFLIFALRDERTCIARSAGMDGRFLTFAFRDERASKPRKCPGKFGRQRKPVTQGGKVARPRRTQRDAREDALEVADAAQDLAQAVMAALVDQCLDRLLAPPQHVAIAQRAMQPAAQQARAHRRDRAVEHAEQGELAVAARMRVEFEVAPGRRIHRDGRVGGFERHAGQVRQRGLLRFLDVAEQGARGGDRKRPALAAEAREIARTEEAREFALGCGRIEMPGRALAQPRQRSDDDGPDDVFRDQGLGRRQPREFGGQRFRIGDFAEQEAARRQVQVGESIARAAGRDRQQQVVATFLEQRRVGHRARRDHPHDLALDQPLRRRRVADLLADRYRLA